MEHIKNNKTYTDQHLQLLKEFTNFVDLRLIVVNSQLKNCTHDYLRFEQMYDGEKMFNPYKNETKFCHREYLMSKNPEVFISDNHPDVDLKKHPWQSWRKYGINIEKLSLKGDINRFVSMDEYKPFSP